MSPDEDDVARLQTDVTQVTAEGAIIAGMLVKAADNAVLTPRLTDMDLKLPGLQTSLTPATTTAVVTITGTSSADGRFSGGGDVVGGGESGDTSLAVGVIAGIIVVALVAAAAITLAITKLSCRSTSPNQTVPVSSCGGTEAALGENKCEI